MLLVEPYHQQLHQGALATGTTSTQLHDVARRTGGSAACAGPDGAPESCFEPSNGSVAATQAWDSWSHSHHPSSPPLAPQVKLNSPGAPGGAPGSAAKLQAPGVGSPRLDTRSRCSIQSSAGSAKPYRSPGPVVGDGRRESCASTTRKSNSNLSESSNYLPPAYVWWWWWPPGVSEVLLNVVGTGGFVVGSFMWLVGMIVAGSWTFAMACVACGIACILYAVKFVLAGSGVGAYSLFTQATGCFMFTGASILFLDDRFQMLALLGFLTASLLFLAGCTLSQVICHSLIGPLAPLFPGMPRHRCGGFGCLPSLVLNTLGSVLFVGGSGLLFYTWLETAGAWCYAIGSILFFIASWADFTTWFNITALSLKTRRHRYCEERRGREGHQLHHVGLDPSCPSGITFTTTTTTTAASSPGPSLPIEPQSASSTTIQSNAAMQSAVAQPHNLAGVAAPSPPALDPNGDYSRIKFL